MKRHVLTLMVVGMVAAACTSGEDPAPSPPPDAMPPTPTEVETDNAPAGYSATEIPAVEDIDLAYVQWVIAEAVTPVEDEAIRIEVEAGVAGESQPPPVIFDMYLAIFGGSHLQFTLEDISDAWDGGGFDPGPLSLDPQPVNIEVTEILDAGPDCIMIVLRRDPSPRFADPMEPHEDFALLRPKPADADPDAINASPWRIVQSAPFDSVRGDTSC
jgi:hypothetical protein